MIDYAKVPQATDEEVEEIKALLAREEIDKDFLEYCIEFMPKLLARLEAVERERGQIERDLEKCQKEIAGEW